MSDPLEQRLRDALAARAALVTRESLDTGREARLRRELARGGRANGRPGPGRVLLVAGLVAASSVVAVTTGLGRDLRPGEHAAGPAAVSSTREPAPAITGTDRVGPAPSAATGTATPSRPAPTAAPVAPSRAGRPTRPQRTPLPQEPGEPGGSAPERPAPAPPQPSPGPSDPAPAPPGPSPSGPTGGTDPTELPAPSTSTTAEYADADLQASAVGDTVVELTASARGAAGPSPVVEYRIDLGDGHVLRSDTTSECDPSQAPQPFEEELVRDRHDYPEPGTYTLTLTLTYCTGRGPETVSTGETVEVR